MKIDFADVLFHKKSSESPTTILGQVLGDISCERLMMAILDTKETTTQQQPLVITELPSSEDEEE